MHFKWFKTKSPSRSECFTKDTVSMLIKFSFNSDFVTSHSSCLNYLRSQLNSNWDMALFAWEVTIASTYGQYLLWMSNNADNIYLSESLISQDFLSPSRQSSSIPTQYTSSDLLLSFGWAQYNPRWDLSSICILTLFRLLSISLSSVSTLLSSEDSL